MNKNALKLLLALGIGGLAVALLYAQGLFDGEDTQNEGEWQSPGGTDASGGSSVSGTKPVELTAANFASTIESSSKPVMVDFWAEWCGPCKMMAPVIDRMAEEFDGKIVVAKLDVDQAGSIAEKHRIQFLPTILIFKNGKEIDRIEGVADQGELSKKLEKLAG